MAKKKQIEVVQAGAIISRYADNKAVKNVIFEFDLNNQTYLEKRAAKLEEISKRHYTAMQAEIKAYDEKTTVDINPVNADDLIFAEANMLPIEISILKGIYCK